MWYGCAMQSWDDQQLALLRPRYPSWDIWTVRTVTARRTAWCARPKGAGAATINVESPEDMIAAIRAAEAGQCASPALKAPPWSQLRANPAMLAVLDMAVPDLVRMQHPRELVTGTLCLEVPGNASGMVRDVGNISACDPLSIGIDQDGCDTRWLQTGSAVASCNHQRLACPCPGPHSP